MLFLLAIFVALVSGFTLDMEAFEKNVHGFVHDKHHDLVRDAQLQLIKDLPVNHQTTEDVEEDGFFDSINDNKRRGGDDDDLDSCEISQCENMVLSFKRNSKPRKNDDDTPTTQARTLVLIQNRSVLVNVSGVTQLYDANHTKAIQYGRGMYNNATAQALDEQGFKAFADNFGSC